MEQIDVSVIMPVFNSRRFLRNSVLSLLKECLPHLEIVVVDDGSTDGSLETISDLATHTIRFATNRGVAAARNAGLAAARGRFITFLDSDDLLCPGGLRWRLDWLNKNPEHKALAGRPAGIIDTEGKLLPSFHHVLDENYTPPETLTLEFFQKGGAYPVPLWNYIFHRDVLKETGWFDESFRIAEDFEYLMRILAHTSIPLVFRPVVYRRLHDSNVSVEQKNGHYTLRNETIRGAQRIFKKLGVVPTQWNLWETGYQSVSAERKMLQL